MKKGKMKSDKFKKARGGPSRLLELVCAKCSSEICRYQKDGPGSLKRLYVDRMIGAELQTNGKQILCASCGACLGIHMIYEKEQRSAYRLLPGAVKKEKGVRSG